MSKCFLTGIEVPLESAFVLDRGATKRALRNLRERLAALERLLSQLGQKDIRERFDPRSKTMKARVENRLVSGPLPRHWRRPIPNPHFSLRGRNS